MHYPVERLNRMHPEQAKAAWAQSLTAVAKWVTREPVPCPVCLGERQLVSFIAGSQPRQEDVFPCPSCKGRGEVTLPHPHDDLYGGWHCCPVCGEGQNDNAEIPCPVCSFIMDLTTHDGL